MILEQSKIFFNDTLAAGASQATVIDLAKLASSMNRKHIPSVDRQGNAQVYMCAVQVKYGTDVLTSIKAAPNLYTTKAAVKAWHDARVKMVNRTGVKMSDLGPYARHLRPFLDVNHENGTTTEASTATSASGGYALNTHFQGDEYTRTRLAVSTPAENTSNSANYMFDAVDTYSLTLCDASVTEDGTPDVPDESGSGSDQDSFVSVGMIAEWLTSINLKRGGLGDGVRIQSDNALLQLIADSPSSEEALELIEDAAEEGRPWDLDGSAYTSLTGQTIFRSGQHNSNKEIIFVPCGLLELTQVNGHSGSELVVTEIEILDIYDM